MTEWTREIVPLILWRYGYHIRQMVAENERFIDMKNCVCFFFNRLEFGRRIGYR